MSEKVIYYAVFLNASDRVDAVGLARRRWLTEGGIEDEMLRRDLTWKRDSVIIEWKRGEATEDLLEISADQASVFIERFRSRWEGVS